MRARLWYMSSSVENYLRTHRKRSGLRQSDMAFLLNLHGGYEISRFERLERVPNLDVAFGCQVLFDTLPHELYPGLYAKVESITRRRVRRLINELDEGVTDGNCAYRRDILLSIIERTEANRPRL